MTVLLVTSEGAASSEDLETLVARARSLGLASERTWRILLHYPTSGDEGESLIDDPRFFLSPQGHQDPVAELEATLAAMLAPGGEDSPRCRFVARFEWLTDRLGIDPATIPPPSCSEFETALAKVDPQSAVLIFPGTHNNSPASMFGHTLINIEGPFHSRLLSYAVNYSAFTDESNGFAYAVKGIFGLYPGYYSVLPYYEKIREYNDLERRDVWEYQLDLTPEEVRRLFLHVWELQGIYADYFFFDENCSYNLLYLLEAARPSLHLTDSCRPWVIPVDTVRLIRQEGLIREARYRPSKATRIDRLASQMSRREQGVAKEVIAGLDPGGIPDEIEDEGRRRILELAAETVEFRYFRKELELGDYRQRYLGLLRERSRLGTGEETPVPAPERPDLGHGSNRLGLGGGVRKGDYFLEVKLRPAYHNLMDADQGYLSGSQIDFANLVVRWYPEDRVELHALDLVNIVSLSPRNPFFKPVSWKVAAGLQQALLGDGEDHLLFHLDSGGGFAWETPLGLTYLLGKSDLWVGPGLDGDWALGPGVSAGFLKTIGSFWKVHLHGQMSSLVVGDTHNRLSVGLDQNVRLGRNQALLVEVSRNHHYGTWFSEGTLSWHLFW